MKSVSKVKNMQKPFLGDSKYESLSKSGQYVQFKEILNNINIVRIRN